MVRERGWSQSNLADEIDHIFVSRNVLVWESHYLAPPASETDHPAHWAVLSLKERQRN
jgi:hypothetical protein